MQSREAKNGYRVAIHKYYFYLLTAFRIFLGLFGIIILSSRNFQSFGQSVFFYPKAREFFHNLEKHHHNNTTMALTNNSTMSTGLIQDTLNPINPAQCLSGNTENTIAYTLGASSLILNTLIRGPNIFDNFGLIPNRPKKQNDYYFNFRGMHPVSAIAYAIFKGFNFGSGIFASLSVYGSMHLFLDFIDQCMFGNELDDNHPTRHSSLFAGIAIAGALLIFINYFLYNIKAGDKHAKHLAEWNLPPRSWAYLFTTILALPGLLSIGMVADYFTKRTLHDINSRLLNADIDIHLNNTAITTIASISFATATVSQFFMNVPPLFQKLQKSNKPAEHNIRYPLRIDLLFIALVIIAALGDAISTLVANFISVTKTMADWTPLEENHPFTITYATATSLSLTVLSLALNVLYGSKQSLEIISAPFKAQEQPNNLDEEHGKLLPPDDKTSNYQSTTDGSTINNSEPLDIITVRRSSTSTPETTSEQDSEPSITDATANTYHAM